MSTFTNNEPIPSWQSFSTDTYNRKHKDGSMTSVILAPTGKDRSVINLHLPVLSPLGVTPKWLMWKEVAVGQIE